jgi:hypothetical protein
LTHEIGAYFGLLWCPFSIGIPVIDDLVRSCVANLRCSVREGAFGLPLELVACGFGKEERLRASGIAVAIDALLDSVVQDLAFSHRRGYTWSESIRIGKEISNIRSVSMPVKARPAVNTL